MIYWEINKCIFLNLAQVNHVFETHCEVREEYKNSEAVLEHMVNLSEVQENAFIDFPVDHVNIYGDPSPELLEAVKGFDIRVYSFSQGLEEKIEA